MKITKLLIVTLLMSFASSFTAKADVTVDATNFPDANFRAFVSTKTGVAEGGTISDAVISNQTSFDCSHKSIASLQGIEFFTALTDLNCYFNNLTALDVTHNTNLTRLICNMNMNIAALDVTNNTKLTVLNCSYNKIPALDVTHATLLKELNCGSNKLTALDISHNTLLNVLDCSSNQLTALDVTNNTLLNSLSCSSNQQISVLDVTHNTLLNKLWCSSCALAALDVSHNTGLTLLNCASNKLTSLNVDVNTALIEFWCDGNQISAINVTKNINLTKFHCAFNMLTSLNVKLNTALTDLDCSGTTGTGKNQIPTLDVTLNAKLINLTCMYNGLTALDVTQNTALQKLLCTDNNLTALDVTHNAALTTLWCTRNKLKALDVTHNTKLSQLLCGNNMLTTLDVSPCTEVTDVEFAINNLSAIDLSHNTKLKQFGGTLNGRKIKVYSYTRSDANGGGKGYYVPLTAQVATDITTNGTTIHYPATKALATLIDDAGQSGDPAFDISRVVSGSWANGATLGTLNGTQVLFLNVSNATAGFTYNYNTAFTGSATQWSSANSATSPNANFYLTWDPNEVATGVDGVESNDADIYTTDGTINIVGSYNGKVNVYNLSGRQVYCGNSSEITVPAGMYVVKVDGAVHKVLVK